MADTKISAAADGDPAQAADAIPVGRAGSPTRVSAQSIADLRFVPTSFPISSVTLLQETLDGKAALVHTHPIESVILLQTTLDGKAALVHTHAVGSVTFVADARLLGRSAGSAGAGQEITVGAGLSLTSGALTATGDGAPSFVRKTADESNTSNTVSIDVADLGFSVAANTTYIIRYILRWNSAATTTGISLGLAGPASPTQLLVGNAIHLAGETSFSSRASVTFNDLIIVAANSLGATVVMAIMEIMLVNGANAGTVIPRFRSEVSGSAITIFANSYGMMWAVA